MDDDDRNLPRAARRRHRSSLLLRLERERRTVEAALEAAGCRFAGRVERRHRQLARVLDAIEAAFQAAWMEAA